MLYVKMKGVDSEKSYNYTDGRKNTGQKHCWKAGENRTVATIDNYTEVQPGSEPQLQAAVRLAPVAVVLAPPAVEPIFLGGVTNESQNRTNG